MANSGLSKDNFELALVTSLFYDFQINETKTTASTRTTTATTTAVRKFFYMVEP